MIEQPLPNTIEFQELIPGIKPPRVPILVPGMENLPLLPGWIIRDPAGRVINAGIRIPVLTWETAQPPEEAPESPPIFRDPCKVEGARSEDLTLACYHGEWVFPHMIPRDYGPCTEERAISADGMQICVNGRWTDRYMPTLPDIPTLSVDALEEEEMEL